MYKASNNKNIKFISIILTVLLIFQNTPKVAYADSTKWIETEIKTDVDSRLNEGTHEPLGNTIEHIFDVQDYHKYKGITIKDPNGNNVSADIVGEPEIIKRDGRTTTLKVTLKGDKFYSKENPKKYSKTETDSKTTYNGASFPSTLNYNSGGYKGSLSTDGSPVLLSGSYTPSQSKYVTAQTSSYYNSGGYSGTLSRYVYSGSYTPADSKKVTVKPTPDYYWFVTDAYQDAIYRGGDGNLAASWTASGPKKYFHPFSGEKTYNYNSEGYKGQLSLTGSSGNRAMHHGSIRENYEVGKLYTNLIKYRIEEPVYEGNVTRPASDTRVYRYQGNVTKPSSDTRTRRQDYKGEVYKSGLDEKLGFKFQLHYENNAPEVPKIIANTTKWTNKSVPVKIQHNGVHSKQLQMKRGSGDWIDIPNTHNIIVDSNEVIEVRALNSTTGAKDSYSKINIEIIDKQPPKIKIRK